MKLEKKYLKIYFIQIDELSSKIKKSNGEEQNILNKQS